MQLGLVTLACSECPTVTSDDLRLWSDLGDLLGTTTPPPPPTHAAACVNLAIIMIVKNC